MGANDHFFDTPDEITTCPNCGKKVIYWTEDQVPGFRDKDYLICPYCKTAEVFLARWHIQSDYPM